MSHDRVPRWAARLVAAACALVIAAALAACTSGEGGTQHTETPPAAAGSSKTVNPPPTFSGVQHPLPTGSALKNVPERYQEVRLTGCAASVGGWKSAGTAHNATSKSFDYRIVVLFTDAQARTVDSAATTVTVPAGSTRDWEASSEFTPPKGTRCVVRAVRAA
ncbi:hypothetical protein [Leifsonia sp. Root112D2]|uniref:hypothetical protein n=1 Tax=Leifsonia sp. Root112D2 TaxID=1736426 RepID=UPI000A827076|nr:hypothetical protein [Leifsonia sp. Root112D2]